MEIRVEHVGVAFDNREILRDVSLTLLEEKLVMLIGPNGCGKTTLMRILMGFQKPDTGEVYYDNISAKRLSVIEKSRKIAYMAQHQNVSYEDTVFDYVMLGVTPYLKYFQLPKKEHKMQVEKVLEELGLADRKMQSLGTLSGGERQMASFARARVQNTSWVLLDEPMASLDFNKQHEFMHRLESYRQQYHQGILMSVHDPNFALRYAQKVIVMGNHGIQGVIEREEKEFRYKLTEVLNKTYGGHLQLVKDEICDFYHWKEV